MFNSSICLNRSGDPSSKWSKDSCPSEVTSLDLTGDRLIGNEKTLMIVTKDQEMSVTSTGPVFQAYRAKNTPWNHCWRLPLSAEFVFSNLFNYQGNPSFLIASWSPRATECTRINKVSSKLFLKIQQKVHLHPRKSFLKSKMEQRNFQKSIMQPIMM